MAYEGTACREPDGWWTIQEEHLLPTTSVVQAPEEPPKISVEARHSTLRPTKELTAEAQTLLSQLGFDPGPVDGLLGNRTRGPIRADQAATGLPQDGEPSAQLLSQLRAEAAEQTRASIREGRVR